PISPSLADLVRELPGRAVAGARAAREDRFVASAQQPAEIGIVPTLRRTRTARSRIQSSREFRRRPSAKLPWRRRRSRYELLAASHGDQVRRTAPWFHRSPMPVGARLARAKPPLHRQTCRLE